MLEKSVAELRQIIANNDNTQELTGRELNRQIVSLDDVRFDMLLGGVGVVASDYWNELGLVMFIFKNLHNGLLAYTNFAHYHFNATYIYNVIYK